MTFISLFLPTEILFQRVVQVEHKPLANFDFYTSSLQEGNSRCSCIGFCLRKCCPCSAASLSHARVCPLLKTVFSWMWAQIQHSLYVTVGVAEPFCKTIYVGLWKRKEKQKISRWKRDTQKRSTKVGGGEGAMLSPKVHTKDAREILFSKYPNCRSKITLLPFRIVRQNTRTYALYIYQDEKKGKCDFWFDFFFWREEAIMWNGKII